MMNYRNQKGHIPVKPVILAAAVTAVMLLPSCSMLQGSEEQVDSSADSTVSSAISMEQTQVSSTAFGAASASDSSETPEWRYLYSTKIQEMEMEYSDDSVTDRQTDRDYWLMYFAITDINLDGVPELYHAKVSTANGYDRPMEGSEEIYYIRNGEIIQGTVADHSGLELGLVPEYTLEYTDDDAATGSTAFSAEPYNADRVSYAGYGLGKRNGQFILRRNDTGEVIYVTKSSDDATTDSGYNSYVQLTFHPESGELSAHELFRTEFSYAEEKGLEPLEGYTLISDTPCFYEGAIYNWTAPYVIPSEETGTGSTGATAAASTEESSSAEGTSSSAAVQ